MSGVRHRAIAFGFFTHRLQAEKLIQASSASFSMRKSAFLRAIYEQISAVRSQIQAGSGFSATRMSRKLQMQFPWGSTHAAWPPYSPVLMWMCALEPVRSPEAVALPHPNRPCEFGRALV